MELFKKHLENYLPKDEIDNLVNSFSLEATHAALLNVDKMDDKTFLSLFPNVKKHPFVEHGYIYDKNEYDLGKYIYHELGCYYLQDPSAMIVASLLDAKEDDYILDLCAAPGGKTIGTSLAMHQKGIIIANDLSKERCRALYDNVSRLGLKNVVITNNDFTKIYQYYLNTFDKIILDAPCSGSGMFRKDIKMIEDWSISKVYKNSLIQCSLIDIAYQMLKPGGTLIYSTCSYSYEEDEEIIKYLLSHSDAQISTITPSSSFYESKDKLGVHIFPHLFNGEGHYICKITKPGILKKTTYEIKKNLAKYLPDEIKDFSSYKFGDFLYSLTYDFKYRGLSIYNFGFKVGELKKDNIIYTYDLAHALTNYIATIDLDYEEAKKYIAGEQLNKTNPYQGNVLLTYHNIPIDFSKTNGSVLKNHYPKYLRKIIK